MYLRIPADLRETIREQAEINRRSLTGEIIYRVLKSYLEDGILAERTTDDGEPHRAQDKNPPE